MSLKGQVTIFLMENIMIFGINKECAYNTGLAKVAVQCSADTFVVKIATFAKPDNVMGQCKKTATTQMAHLVFAETQPNAEKPKEPIFATHRQTERQ